MQEHFDPGLLEAAVVTCQQEYYKGVFLKAAALLRSLICDHPFLDGNKRTAVIAVAAFLELNGWEFAASQHEVVRFALRIAKGWERDLRRIKSWLRKRCRRLRGPGGTGLEVVLDKGRKVDRNLLTSMVKRWGGLVRWGGRIPRDEG